MDMLIFMAWFYGGLAAFAALLIGAIEIGSILRVRRLAGITVRQIDEYLDGRD